MRHSLILISAMSMILVSVANGAVRKGQVDLEILGGMAIETTSDASTQDEVTSGAINADLDAWFASVGISWFRTPNLQLGITGFYSSMDGSETVSLIPNSAFPNVQNVYDADADVTIYGAGGRAKWHFSPTSNLVPFVGIQASWASADIDVSGQAKIVINGVTSPGSEAAIDGSDSPTGILWGPIAGLRLKIGETDDLLFEYQYHMWAGSIGDVLDNGHAIAIGLSHRMK